MVENALSHYIMVERVFSHDEQVNEQLCAGVRERAVRMAFDHERDYPSKFAAVLSIAESV